MTKDNGEEQVKKMHTELGIKMEHKFGKQRPLTEEEQGEIKYRTEELARIKKFNRGR